MPLRPTSSSIAPAYTDRSRQITNSARDHTVLGTLNGLAQTLSASGRAVAPFLSGGLFTIAEEVKPKGEALAFGVFGGVAFVGFILSLFIQGGNLEGQEWDEEEDGSRNEDSDKSEDEDEEQPTHERSQLLNRRG